MRSSFNHVTEWVFDLDNTLYDPKANLFMQMEARMTAFITKTIGVAQAEAARLCDVYLQSHGTTVAGLIDEHGIEPDPFLEAVHDIDLSALSPDPELKAAIAALPGKKIVYTNGSRGHAERVVTARGLNGVFDALYGIEDAGYQAKPNRVAFETVFDRARITTDQAAMFEDDVRNLAIPHGLGMQTILVGNLAAAPDVTHVTHATGDLTGFLSHLG